MFLDEFQKFQLRKYQVSYSKFLEKIGISNYKKMYTNSEIIHRSIMIDTQRKHASK